MLAGDIDATWAGYERFAGWPAPVVVVAGNHEFDGRDLERAWPELRERCDRLGFTLLQREELKLDLPGGRRVRLLGATRWSDFDLFGAAGRERAERAAGYFLRLMNATRRGRPFDAAAVRDEGLACRAWLEQALARPAPDCGATVVITHFGPSLRSADPRFGKQPGTASFCNADDDLIARADLWLHGHLHCRHDYTLARAGRRPARVVCNARGQAKKNEEAGYDPRLTVELPLPAAAGAA